ncbi:MAG: glycosyltransferase [Actinobacteria bacterium]|nr:glycosyltransferase [Actinomycetota bacterium]
MTVIVPYYNEAELVVQTLEQLRAQTLVPSAVIMVNSSSTDNSSSIVDGWILQNESSLPCRYINLNSGTNTPGGSKAAGVDIATTELVAFMDCGLNFSPDWLASQLAMLLGDSHAVWVSGGLITSGEGITDKCAIAHTYGYRRFRPCMPSSLLRRNIFETVGRFKDLRAGYDAQWIRDANRFGQKRLINESVVVSYLGTSFAANLWQVFKKSILYARPTLRSGNKKTPPAYVLAAVLGSALAIFLPSLFVVGVVAYFFARLGLAIKKSKSNAVYFLRPDRLVMLLLTGAVLDFGKLVGYLRGLIDSFPTK